MNYKRYSWFDIEAIKYSNITYRNFLKSQLCGQHCLNNLVQGNLFDAGILASIANDLDKEERLLMDNSESLNLRDGVYGSANVDDSGNFSIQVLRNALYVWLKVISSI